MSDTKMPVNSDKAELWGLVLEGPVIQTFATEQQRDRWGDELKNFWGHRPAAVERENESAPWMGTLPGRGSGSHRERVQFALDEDGKSVWITPTEIGHREGQQIARAMGEGETE